MDAYFDTAIILKLYVQEATSPAALRLAHEFPAPCLLTPWQEIEVRTALRLKAFRKEITRPLKCTVASLYSGVFQRPDKMSSSKASNEPSMEVCPRTF